MLTNATFLLQVTMKSPQILMNLKLKAVKKKKYGNPKLALAECAKTTLQILV